MIRTLLKTQSLTFFSCLFLFLSGVVFTSSAETIKVISNGSWHNPAIWDNNCLPTKNDDVVIDGFKVQLNARHITIRSLLITNTSNAEARLSLFGDGTLTITKDLLLISLNINQHVDLNILENSFLKVNGSVHISRTADNESTKRLRLYIGDHAQMLVLKDLTYYYLNSSSSENQSEIILKSNGKLMVDGRMQVYLQNGNDFSLVLKDKSQLLVDGKISLIQKGGDDLRVSLDDQSLISTNSGFDFLQVDGDKMEILFGVHSNNSEAELRVKGNLTVTLKTNRSGSLQRIQLNDHCRVTVQGDLIMNTNESQRSSGQLIELKDRSKWMNIGDVVFQATSRSKSKIQLINNSRWEINGNFLRGGLAGQFGSFKCFGNASLIYSGTEEQIMISSGEDEQELIRYQNVFVRNKQQEPPQIVLEGSVTINGNLHLEEGIIRLADHDLIIGKYGYVIGGSEKNFINVNSKSDGKLIYKMSLEGEYIFPVGDDDSYSPFAITLNKGTIFSSDDFISVQISKGAHEQINTSGDYLNRSWNINSNGFEAINYDIVFEYNDADVVGDESKLMLAEWNGDYWVGHTLAQVDENKLTNIKSIVDLPENHDFLAGNGQALSLEVFGFDVIGGIGFVNIYWKTATQKERYEYVVEKSIDGINYEWVASLNGIGRTTSLIPYNIIDNNTVYREKVYYRLKQLDLRGNLVYTSKPTEVEYQLIDRELPYKEYPGQVAGSDKFYIQLDEAPGNGETTIVLYDTFGKEILTKVVFSSYGGEKTVVNIERELTPGVYHVIGSNDNEIFKQKLTIR
ncbi:MAG: hypothetical protein IIA45_11585 [Bacteroidetes bacterium]|nr:hypothetical protein [Bacteroidota bacterium]